MRPIGIRDDVQALIKSTGWPTWTTPCGKGLTEETLPNFHGIYRGSFDNPTTRAFYEGSDLVLFFGPHFSSSNSYAYSSKPRNDTEILFTMKGVLVSRTPLSGYIQQADTFSSVPRVGYLACLLV